jgi:hypothetical protein
MSITQDLAAEEYQLMNDVLMEIAQDYSVPPEAADIVLAAANEVELQFLDNEIEDDDELEEQYADFIDYIESVIEDLEDNEVESHLISPLKKRLTKAKKRLS